MDRPTGPLFDLYERYVGEPRTRKDVYGYVAFIVGYALGLAGVTAYLAGSGSGAPDFALREASIATSAVGLALGMFGVVLLLPVRRRGIQASALGLLVALASVAAFVSIYPARWTGSADASGGVITAYTLGIAVVTGVAAMVPVVTGEKGWLVSEVEDGREHPPVMVGEATRGALFALYQVGTGQWTWRVLSQEALGEHAGEPYARPDIESAVEGLRSTLSEARLLEITTAAFRLYETAEGAWRWSLMGDDGSVLAESGETYVDRDAVGETTSLLKERGPDAPLVDLRGAAFDCYEDDGRWRWRLLDESRSVLAAGATAYEDPAAAEDAIEDVRARFDDVPLLALDALGVELYEAEDEDEWRWQLVDDADDVLATGADGFESRRAAESAVTSLLPDVGGAAVWEAGEPGYEPFRDDDGWQFRLVDGDGESVARNHAAYREAAAATDGAVWMAETVEDADVVQYDDGEFEVHPTDEGWHWRLVTEEREVVAASTDAYADAAEAEAAVGAVCERVGVADLIEFENAAFQQYESGGRWRWRLIDEDGNVMADSGEDYATRGEVGDAMTTLKEHAPTAEILEIEGAAFELFEDESGAWGWRLIDEGGAMVARSAARHPSRAAARTSMEFLVDRSEDAEARTMERAAFQLYADDEDAWRWRYLHPDGDTVVDGTRGHATRDQLVESVAAVRAVATDATVRTFDPLGVELFPRGAGWGFRLLDGDRETVAESAADYETLDAVHAAVETVQAHAAEATVFAIDAGALRVVSRDGAYRWELVDGERSVLSRGPSSYEDPGLAEVAADKVATLAPDASLVDFDTAAFQLERGDDGWGWRLVDEAGATIATGAAEHATQSAVRESIASVRSILEDASVLEIEDAAFELHRGPEGWTWQLVDENGRSLVRSVGAFSTRSEARESLGTVKENGPEGWVSVVE